MDFSIDAFTFDLKLHALKEASNLKDNKERYIGETKQKEEMI